MALRNGRSGSWTAAPLRAGSDEQRRARAEFAASRREHRDALADFARVVDRGGSGATRAMADIERAIDRLDASFRRLKVAASVVVGQDCNLDYAVASTVTHPRRAA